MNLIRNILLGIIFFASPALFAQEAKLRVVTKTIEKIFDFNQDDYLSVDAQKANVLVEGWDKDYVYVELQMQAKHQDIKIAKKEISYLQANLAKMDKQIIFSNSLATDNKLSSIIKAQYLIKVPKKCGVWVRNNFGKTFVSDLDAPIIVHIKYGDVDLLSCKKNAVIQAKFGNIMVKNCEGSYLVETDYSDVQIDNIVGEISGNIKNGDINIVPGGYLTGLDLTSTNADISFKPSSDALDYDIRSKYGDIYFGEKEDLVENHSKDEKSLQYNKNNARGKVTIKSSFGKVSIE